MAYEPTIWKDRAVEKPRTYTLQNNPDGTVTLVPAPGTVVEVGTPVNAANLNKLELGLKTHEADKTHWKKLDTIVTSVATTETILQLPQGHNQLKIKCKGITRTAVGAFNLRLSANVNFGKLCIKGTTITNTFDTPKIADDANDELRLNNGRISSFEVEIDNNLDVDNFANIKASLYYDSSSAPYLIYGDVKTKINKITTLTLLCPTAGQTYNAGVVFEIWGR